jgi:hypothetical protein
MLHVIVVAIGLFVSSTGQMGEATMVTDSPTACAAVINSNREPRQLDDGSTVYLVKAECVGAYVDDAGNVTTQGE